MKAMCLCLHVCYIQKTRIEQNILYCHCKCNELKKCHPVSAFICMQVRIKQLKHKKITSYYQPNTKVSTLLSEVDPNFIQVY